MCGGGGVDLYGLNFSAGVSDTLLTNTGSDLLISRGGIGINKNQPDSSYKIDVDGNVNALKYIIEDKFSDSDVDKADNYSYDGFSEFEIVPSGVIILWLDTALPSVGEWAWCDGSVVNVNGNSFTTPDLSTINLLKARILHNQIFLQIQAQMLQRHRILRMNMIMLNINILCIKKSMLIRMLLGCRMVMKLGMLRFSIH